MDTQPRRRKKKVLRILKWIGVSLVVLAIVDQIVVYAYRRITISRETTRITGPLLSDGTPDYLAALDAAMKEGVTPENNAAIPLLEITGTGNLTNDERRDLYRALGVTPFTGNVTFTSYADFWVELIKKRLANGGKSGLNLNDEEHAIWEYGLSGEAERIVFDKMNHAMEHGWTAQEEPELSLWFEQNQASLGPTEEVVKRTRLYVPPKLVSSGYPETDPYMVPEVQATGVGKIPPLGSLIRLRALQRLKANDGPGFELDILNTIRLARLLDDLPGLEIHYGALRMENATYRMVLSNIARLPEAECRSLIEKMSELKLPRTAARAMDGEQRFQVLSTICQAKKLGFAEIEREWNFKIWLRVYPFSFDQCLRDANHAYDEAVTTLALPTYVGRNELQRMSNLLAARAESGEWVHPEWSFLHNRIFFHDTANQLQTRTAALRQLALGALALNIYWDKNHTFPQKLEDLKAIGMEIPTDPFTDMPLIYKPSGTSFTLYSVGANLRDDGGVENEELTNGDYPVTVTREK